MSTPKSPPSHTITVGVPKTAHPRLGHLVEVLNGDNRGAFLRMVTDRLKVVDRAQRLRSAQSYGAKRSTDLGIAPSEITDRVKRVLARRPEE